MQDTLSQPGNPFAVPGHWYKAALHTHTSLSDGMRSPEEVAAWYRGHGFQVLALTDHNVRTDVEGLNRPDFVTIPGAELHPGRTELGEPYHLVAVGIGRTHVYTAQDSVQEAIDALRADGAVVWLAHPYWLGLTLPEIVALRGIIGVEVYNATCEEYAKGLSTVHWDDALARRYLCWGLAVDDAHWHRHDYGRGWVMARAPELTAEAILRALEAGHFYASQGPEIHAVEVTSERVYVRCSPACRISCVSLCGYGGPAAVPGPDGLLTEAAFPRRQMRVYARVECTDAAGRTAWSQPIMID